MDARQDARLSEIDADNLELHVKGPLATGPRERIDRFKQPAGAFQPFGGRSIRRSSAALHDDGGVAINVGDVAGT
ncbi:MAG: hypothetical protein AAF961_10540 [Planctomycetota bacterium]